MRRAFLAVFVLVGLVACAPDGEDTPPGTPAAAPTAGASTGGAGATGTGTTGGSGGAAAGGSGAAAGHAAAATLPPMEVTGTATDTIVLGSEGPVLQFVPDRFTAEAGTRILVRYENGGELPHNFALFRDDGVVDRFVLEAFEAQSSGYIPVTAKDDMIAYTPLVSPGQAAEMEFVVPPPGRYTFICLFPGHSQMMLGTLTSR